MWGSHHLRKLPDFLARPGLGIDGLEVVQVRLSLSRQHVITITGAADACG